MAPKIEDRQITLRQFDIKNIGRHTIIVFIGRRGTGKSFLIQDILYHHRDIPIGLVMSHTDHLQHFYDRFIPNMLIHKGYNSEQLQKLFDRQEKALEEKWIEPTAFLLLDDVLSDKTWKKDPRFQEVFFNGRHSKLLAILGIQSPMGIGPDLRDQIDYTFIFKSTNQANRKKLYENYAGAFKTFEEFNIVLDATTEDYNCLVVDNRTQSNKIEDQIFYYKAKMHDNFRICTSDIWEINDKRNFKQQANKYKQNYVKTEVMTKKGKVTINRKK